MVAQDLSPRKIGTQAREIVVERINWKFIAIAAIGVLAVANLMMYLAERRK